MTMRYLWFTLPVLCLLMIACPRPAKDCKEGEHLATSNGMATYCTPDCKDGMMEDEQGVCVAGCKKIGACLLDADCCSGVCSADACVCADNGAACKADLACCSGQCGVDGFCDDPGTPTGSDTDPVSASTGSTGGSTGTSTSTTGGTTTGGSTTGGSTTGGSTTGDGTTGAPPAEGYGDCVNFPSEEACLDGEVCGELNGGLYVCSLEMCKTDAVCPVPSTGTAKPFCSQGFCFLLCDSKVCPDGMVCTPGIPAFCGWEPVAPPEWTCNPDFYGMNHGCDCGCGVVDLGCANSNPAICDHCDDPGSCSPEPCPGTISLEDNAICK